MWQILLAYFLLMFFTVYLFNGAVTNNKARFLFALLGVIVAFVCLVISTMRSFQ